jgi:diaminopimelate decarboxylase
LYQIFLKYVKNLIKMNKTIPFNINELEKLRNEYFTPYYIYDGDGIKTNVLNYMDKFS